MSRSAELYILIVMLSILYTIWIKNNNQSFTVIYFLVFRCSDDSFGFLPRFLHFPVIYDLINYLKTIGVKEYLFQKKIFPDLFIKETRIQQMSSIKTFHSWYILIYLLYSAPILLLKRFGKCQRNSLLVKCCVLIFTSHHHHQVFFSAFPFWLSFLPPIRMCHI